MSRSASPFRLITCVCAAVLACAVQGQALAAELYVGGGLHGIVGGVGLGQSASTGARLEAAGLSRSAVYNQREGGVDYSGRFTMRRAMLLGDWRPFDGSFRLSAGLSANDIGLKVHGLGSGTTTINGKPIDLSKETFDVSLQFPRATPYVGLGWGHQLRDSGLGFFFDVGVLVGKFRVDAQTSVVGKNGITQADVDAEVAKARDAVARYNVFPSLQLGMSWHF